MRYKYVEADYPRYFIFGEHPSGMVDIATENNSTVATLSREQATSLIADRSAVVDKLCEMACAFDEANPEKFKEFWYGC